MQCRACSVKVIQNELQWHAAREKIGLPNMYHMMTDWDAADWHEYFDNDCEDYSEYLAVNYEVYMEMGYHD